MNRRKGFDLRLPETALLWNESWLRVSANVGGVCARRRTNDLWNIVNGVLSDNMQSLRAVLVVGEVTTYFSSRQRVEDGSI